MRTMTYREYLKTPDDYRTVTTGPRRCAVLTYDPAHGTTLETVRVTDDYVAEVGRTVNDGYLAVTARTHTLDMQAPYFSVTAELWDSQGWYERGGPDGRMRACGCLHDDILAAFPKLAPLVALHLADATTGEPNYAFENGWYHYRQGDYIAAARLLRVKQVPAGLDENGFRDYVNAQRARWTTEAAEGRALIIALRDGVA